VTCVFFVVPQAGVEPAADRLGGWDSNRADLHRHASGPPLRTAFAQAERPNPARRLRMRNDDATGSFDLPVPNMEAVSLLARGNVDVGARRPAGKGSISDGR
jgi:hypothetical protein